MIKGIEQLRAVMVGISTFSEKARRLAFDIGRIEMEALQEDFVGRTPMETGKARGSWTHVIESANTLYFELKVPYGYALDEGSIPGERPWPNPGPKTALYKGKIFSSQVADGGGGISAEILTEQRKGDIAMTILHSLEKELRDGMGR